MSESPQSVVLPKGLKHWINSFKSPSCVLLSKLEDLTDGQCLFELVGSIFESQIAVPQEHGRTPAGRIQCALNAVGDAIGWNSVPPEFKNLNCARAISTGEPTITLSLLHFLHSLHTQRNNISGSFDADSDVERAVLEMRQQGSQSSRRASGADKDEQLLTFTPKDGTAMNTDRNDADSLEDSLEEDLHVTGRARSSVVSVKRATAAGLQAKTPARSMTPPLILQHKRTAATTGSKGHDTSSSRNASAGAGQLKRSAASNLLESSRATVSLAGTKTGLVKRKLATHPPRKPAATTATASTEASGSARKQHTAPAGITVHHGTGLKLGTGLVDPSYKPKASNHFAETVEPSPPAPSSSSESESDDGITRPTYDHLFDGQQRQFSQTRMLRDRALLNARLPLSRSLSPVGKRHVHCQLHSVADATRAVSRDRFGLPISDIHKASGGVVSVGEDLHSQGHLHYVQRLRQQSPNDGRAKQARQVLDVFRRQAADQQSQQRRHSAGSGGSARVTGRRASVVDIDSAVETDRKNAILEWMQRQLGVTLEVWLTPSTAYHYNIGAGRNLTLSDAIEVTKKMTGTAETAESGSKRHARDTKAGGSLHSDLDKENYPFFPVPEDVLYIPGRTPNMPGSYSIASYLGRITHSAPAYTGNAAEQVAAQQLQAQEQRQQLLQIPPYGPHTRPFVPPAGHKTPVTPVGFLNDPWINGVLLSEVVAALFVENRALIKQVEAFDRFGRPAPSPKLILAGTEFVVRSRAQAMHNIQLCMDVISANVPGFPTLDYCAEDILNGTVSLWRLLDSLHETVRHNMRFRCGSRGRRSASRERGRSRSASPSAGSRSRVVRSISAPPAVREEPPRVSFSASTAAPAPSPARARGGEGSASQPQSKVGRAGTPGTRSRSVSPSARSVTSQHSHTSAGGEIDAAAVSLLELRRQEKEHERVRARLYAQKKREKQAVAATSVGTPSSALAQGSSGSAPAAAPAPEWNASVVVEKPRSGSAPRRGSVTTAPSTGPAGAGAAASQGAGGSANGGDQPSSRIASDKTWFPPRLSQTEVEAALHTPLPSVSVYQQRGIREWIQRTFHIRLLDGECGFAMLAGGEGDGRPSTAAAAELLVKSGGKADPRFETVSQHAPPPLPLQEDRLRNGVLLGQLLMRLEPHAAMHAHIPRLLHKRPRSMAVCLENVERVLWVFKLRRCPPIPLQYLCQPEEVLKGTVPLVWGLLWEIMQAYPYATGTVVSSADSTTVSGKPPGTLGGVTTAEAKYVTPREAGPHQHRIPIRDGLARIFDQAADVAANRQRSAVARRASTTGAGLKGAEAKHYVPSNVRYNYADPHLENPVAAHTLPYSDQQRHRLDLSLLHWLQESGIMTEIVGSLAQPVTVLALETYCRDGTLFCMIAERVLKLTLAKEWHRRPATYSECMSNLKHCLDVLRKCQAMRPRYLYSGVEEDICRGKWDSILGLLEDMHRFADRVHPHAQIVNTVDAQGKFVRDVGGSAGFNYATVEAPYLGSNPQFTAMLEAMDSDELLPADAARHSVEAGATKGPPETEWSQPGAFAAALNPAHSTRSNLLHDVPNTFAPALDLAPPPPAPAPTTRPATPGLGAQHTLPLSQDFLAPGPHSEGDLYPSNPVGGQNVVDILSRQGEGQEDPRSPPPNAPPPQYARNTGGGSKTQRSSRIPTPVRQSHSLTASSPPSDAPDSPSSVPRPRSALRPPTLQQSRMEPDSLEKDRAEGRRLAQALNLTASETETRGRDPVRTPFTSPKMKNQQGQSSPPRSPSTCPDHGATSTGQRWDREKSRSPSKRRSPSPTRGSAAPALSNSAVRRFHQYNRRGLNTTAASEFDADSLEAGGSSPGSPDSVRDSLVVENITNNVDVHKVRRVLQWFNGIGLQVEHKNSNFANHTFSDGVVLCALLQRLERCGPLAGTHPRPRNHSERVQNVRRCLEMLATRHKSIPLRTLSCEEDVLDGNMARTVDLLLSIRKAYANHRL